MSEPPSDKVGPARKRFGALFTQHLLDNPVRPTIKYTNNAFALAIGMKPPTIGYWRKGTSLPETEARLEKIIDLFFRDFPGYEGKKNEFRLAFRLAQQEPYPYGSQGSEESNKEVMASPSSPGVEKPVGSVNNNEITRIEQPAPKPLAAERSRQESLLDIETLRAVNITGPAAPEAVEFSAKRNFRFRMPPYFMGREETLSAIDTAFKLTNGALAIAVLHGLRGVGKTTLAFAYADRCGDDYRALWRIDAQNDLTMRADLAALGRRLGWVGAEEKEELAFAAALDRLPSDGEGILLIYDNAVDADAIRPFLPTGGAARVLITSNSDAWRTVATAVIEIPIWPREIGARFLIDRSGRRASQEVAEALSDALGGLPLAHEMAGAYCERLKISLDEYKRRFAAAPVKLLDDTRYAPADYRGGTTVTKTFRLAIDEAAKLHPAAEALIAHAALLASAPIPLFVFSEGRERFDEPLASALADDGLEEALTALRVFALVERQEIIDDRDASITTDAIHLHRLVREIAVMSLEDAARDQLRSSLLAALEAIYPARGYEDPTSSRLCTLLMPHLLATCEPEMADTTTNMRSFALLQRACDDLRQAAYSKVAALYDSAPFMWVKPSENPYADTNLHDLVILQMRGGDAASALGLAEVPGPDHPSTATNLSNIALLFLEQGDLAKSRSLHERALAIREKVLPLDHLDTATSLNNLAILHVFQGEIASAWSLLKRALAIYEKVGSEHKKTKVVRWQLRFLSVLRCFSIIFSHQEISLPLCLLILGAIAWYVLHRFLM
jgi:tetratricopeptide (TPR) repeat protein